MRLILALGIVSGIVSATLFFQAGLWPLGVLLVLVVIANGLLLARTWTGPREYPTGEYMENDRSYW